MSKRVTLEFSDKALEKLDHLKFEADCSTRAALIRNALRLYEVWLEKKNAGYKFVIEKDDEQSYFEVIL